jgi:hypothetical protein
MKNPNCKYLEILRTEEVQETGQKMKYSKAKKPHLFLAKVVRLVPSGLLFRPGVAPYFLATTFAGSSGFLSLPSMYGLHGLALTGPGVFHTTLN